MSSNDFYGWTHTFFFQTCVVKRFLNIPNKDNDNDNDNDNDRIITGLLNMNAAMNELWTCPKNANNWT